MSFCKQLVFSKVGIPYVILVYTLTYTMLNSVPFFCKKKRITCNVVISGSKWRLERRANSTNKIQIKNYVSDGFIALSRRDGHCRG
jgi:hypothetical protein